MESLTSTAVAECFLRTRALVRLSASASYVTAMFAVPVKQDKLLTRAFVLAAAALQIKVVDHLVVSTTTVLSFRKEGLLGEGHLVSPSQDSQSHLPRFSQQ